MSVFLLLFALADEVWVEAYAGIIHEYAAVNLADIHLADLAGKEITDGGSEVERNTDILGEMVQRAHRQNTERCIGACELAGHCIDSALTSAGGDRVTAVAHGGCGQRRDIVAAL